MTDATPIGTGRYALAATLPATLPRVVRHVGRDTILDRTVTVLMLTDATPHRAEVLESASRAVLVEDERIQRVFDVETDHPAFIVTEPADGRPLSELVGQGLDAAQVRAIVGEIAQALDACSRRGLHHLNLSPESVRLRPNGTVQVTGIGVEAAILGLDAKAASDPLEADRIDARALVELLYYGLTKRWPGKRAGLPSAPTTSDGAPVPPSMLAMSMGPDDADLDDLVASTWAGEGPASASHVARALGSWDASLLPRTTADSAVPSSPDSASEPALRGVLSRLRRASATHESPAAAAAPSPGESQADALSQTTAPQTPQSFAPSATAPPVASPPAAPQIDNEIRDFSAIPPAVQPTSPPVNTVNTAGTPRTDDEDDDEVSRSISRTTIAVISGMLVVMVVGVIFAVNSILGLLNLSFTDPDVPAASTVPTTAAAAQDDQQSSTDSSTPTGAPIRITGAQSVDSSGGQGDHPENEGLAVDGNSSTTWYSQHYYGARFGNLKSGTGIAVSLEQAAEVSGIDIQGTGQGGNVQIRATTPGDPTGGTVLAEGAFTSGTTSFTFPATSTQSIVIWVTDPPTAPDGELKISVSEITLK